MEYQFLFEILTRGCDDLVKDPITLPTDSLPAMNTTSMNDDTTTRKLVSLEADYSMLTFL